MSVVVVLNLEDVDSSGGAGGALGPPLVRRRRERGFADRGARLLVRTSTSTRNVPGLSRLRLLSRRGCVDVLLAELG